MILGFTGNRYGMTLEQKLKFVRLLELYPTITEVHHGDCVGSDADAHHIVREYLPHIPIITHPPSNPRLQAYCNGDRSEPRRPYMARNHRIVEISNIVIATPREMKEQQRSGTWATIRYARKLGRPLGIIYPTGKVTQ